MKKTNFKIFYSWMSDRPDKQNRKYIRNKLSADIKKLEKDLSVKILLDSDSRSEDGSKPIDESILKKITACDYFICDITPIPKGISFWNKKTFIPNPNVLYELGFAVSAIGWNRCIMVYNERFGDISQAPFDIRNHVTVGYRIGTKELSLYSILKEKIKKYDDLIQEWRSNKEVSFDAAVFARINNICTEEEFWESIRFFIQNRVYNRKEFKWWDHKIHHYKTYPFNRFCDDEIHAAYLSFLDGLEELCRVASTYNVDHHNNKLLSGDEPDYDEQYRYLIRDPYDTISDSKKALKMQQEIDDAFSNLKRIVLPNYIDFRTLITKKLLI